METKGNNKITRSKLGLLNLAQELGKVSKACKVMGFSDIYFTAANQQLKKLILRGFWIYPERKFS